MKSLGCTLEHQQRSGKEIVCKHRPCSLAEKEQVEGDDDNGREGESRGELRAARFLASTMTDKHLTAAWPGPGGEGARRCLEGIRLGCLHSYVFQLDSVK